MNKPLEKHKPPKLAQEQMYNPHNYVFIEEVEFVAKTLTSEKTPGSTLY